VVHLETWQWGLAAAAALIMGFSKTGMSGLGILAIPMMAVAFPARESTGIVLPMLICGDVLAVAYYRRDAVWGHLFKLIPWVIPGLLLGYMALGRINEPQMRIVLGGIVLAMIALQVVRARCGDWMENKLPHTWWFAAFMGLLAGFATMLANAAGPVMVVYLLAHGLPKKEFMGTGAWYFLIVNCLKVPLSANLGLVTPSTLTINACLIPVILVGGVLGILFITRIPQKTFEKAVLLIAALASVNLLIPWTAIRPKTPEAPAARVEAAADPATK